MLLTVKCACMFMLASDAKHVTHILATVNMSREQDDL